MLMELVMLMEISAAAKTAVTNEPSKMHYSTIVLHD
jgi:hypothetical protein